MPSGGSVISCLINGGVKSVLAVVAAVWYGDTGSSPGPLQDHELAAYVGLYLGRYRPHGLGIGENGFVFRILPDHEDGIPLLPTDLEGVPVTFEVQHMATMWGEPPAHDRLGRLGRLWDYLWPHQEPPRHPFEFPFAPLLARTTAAAPNGVKRIFGRAARLHKCGRI